MDARRDPEEAFTPCWPPLKLAFDLLRRRLPYRSMQCSMGGCGVFTNFALSKSYSRAASAPRIALHRVKKSSASLPHRDFRSTVLIRLSSASPCLHDHCALTDATSHHRRGKTMKALVYNGPKDVAVKDVPDARIEKPTDALVEITSTNICGSDLICTRAARTSRKERFSATRTWEGDRSRRRG